MLQPSPVPQPARARISISTVDNAAQFEQKLLRE
jgi:hypothetical protein